MKAWQKKKVSQENSISLSWRRKQQRKVFRSRLRDICVFEREYEWDCAVIK